MNGRQIFWLAALLALQAAALSLLQSGLAQASQTSQPTRVYRCDMGYQQLPCATAEAQSVLVAADPRTKAQVAQSRQLGKQELKAYKRLIKQRQREIRKAPKVRAVALSSAKPGEGPFGPAPKASDSTGRKTQNGKRQVTKLRIANVPQNGQGLQAAAEVP